MSPEEDEGESEEHTGSLEDDSPLLNFSEQDEHSLDRVPFDLSTTLPVEIPPSTPYLGRSSTLPPPLATAPADLYTVPSSLPTSSIAWWTCTKREPEEATKGGRRVGAHLQKLPFVLHFRCEQERELMYRLAEAQEAQLEKPVDKRKSGDTLLKLFLFRGLARLSSCELFSGVKKERKSIA